MNPGTEPHMILMLVHDRPIYTYMTLDSFQRATQSPYALVVFHHLSADPLVQKVLDSFVARGVISEIVEISDEHVDYPSILAAAMARGLGEKEFFYFLENDVVIEKADRCWIDRMQAAFRADPGLAMVGSAIDTSDFIDPEVLAAQMGRPLDEHELEVIKARSPERGQRFENGTMVGTVHNVPGRFLGLRTKAITEGVLNVDWLMDAALRQRGWKTRILHDVRHRHLSLLNYYDYFDYYQRRETHVSKAIR